MLRHTQLGKSDFGKSQTRGHQQMEACELCQPPLALPQLHKMQPPHIGSSGYPDHHEVLMSPCPTLPTAVLLRGQFHPLLCLGSPSSWEFWGNRLDLWLPWQPGSGPHQGSLAFQPTEMCTDSSSSPCLCTEESHAPVVDRERASISMLTVADV